MLQITDGTSCWELRNDLITKEFLHPGFGVSDSSHASSYGSCRVRCCGGEHHCRLCHVGARRKSVKRIDFGIEFSFQGGDVRVEVGAFGGEDLVNESDDGL